MWVVGTAGHVDHGKSTLVEALTGMNPDRLREEQERQMTIDLGFAWMELPSGGQVGIVDVPGHRDFIENMLAGVGGIDAALLIVAADEGVMPQTREHLAILDLLEVGRGVIAVTKTDLVEDEEWEELIKEEVARLVANTTLVGSPMVSVSAVSGQGLTELRAALEEVLSTAPPRKDRGRPRLPIDRAFTIAGFGTVVTGTLVDGHLNVGDEVEVLPGGLGCRIRGLQTHKAKVELALPGSRVAANLSGVEVGLLARGDVVAYPGTHRGSLMIDVRFRLISEAEAPLKHNQQVKLFVGTAQRMARVRLLGADVLRPGDEGWLQLVMDKPVVTVRGDHYIVRRPSPAATIGGGQVVEPNPARRHRRWDEETLSRLEGLIRGTPGEVLRQVLETLGPSSLKTAVRTAGFDSSEAKLAMGELLDEGEIVNLGKGQLGPESENLVVDAGTWGRLQDRMEDILSDYHRANPLRLGMPREELKSRVRLEAKPYGAVLGRAVALGVLVQTGQTVALAKHEIRLTGDQEAGVLRLVKKFEDAGSSPPSVKECVEQVGEELMSHLVESGRLVQVSADVVFLGEAYRDMVDAIVEGLKVEGSLSVAQVRDMFSTSRKYALGLMEHLDEKGVTRREGDVRRLTNKGGSSSGT